MRTTKISKEEAEDQIKLAEMAKDVSYIKEEVIKINTRLEKDYITRQEFEPIKKIVYGVIGIILTAVMGAMLGLILIK